MELIEQKQDLLKEIVNIGVGRAAGILNDMIDMEIELEVPIVLIESLLYFREGLIKNKNIEVSKVNLVFKKGLEGFSEIIFSKESATKITGILTGEEEGSPDLEIATEGTISELGNIMLNGVMGSFSNMLDIELEYDVPVYNVEKAHNIYSQVEAMNVSLVLVCKTKFSINKINFDGQIIVVIREGSINELDKHLNKSIH